MGSPKSHRGNLVPPELINEELISVPAARLDTQVVSVFPFLWDFSLISTQGFLCTSGLARSPQRQPPGTGITGNQSGLQVLAPPGRAFSVHPIP